MSSTARTRWTTALGVFSVLASLCAGFFTRQGMEGSRPVTDLSRGTLVASRGELPQLSDTEYFSALARLLKSEYVDPVTDDAKLAAGAVRGMINRLGDEDAVFMNPKQFSAYRAARGGKFEGIGVELRFQYDAQQKRMLAERKTGGDPAMLIPRLEVTAVLPESPASRAGMRVGDVIESVDDRWVLSAETIREFRDRQREVNEGTLPPEALDELRKRMREKARSGLSPASARDRLSIGAAGQVKVAWRRGGRRMEATIAKMALSVPAVTKLPDGAIALRLFEGAERELSGAIASRERVTLDLRNATRGDFATFRRVLAVLAPAGRYGTIEKTRSDAAALPVKVERGRAKKLERLVVRIDASTHGAAQALAVALRDAGLATIEGSGMAPDRTVTESVALADGSGYVLPIGTFRTAKGGRK